MPRHSRLCAIGFAALLALAPFAAQAGDYGLNDPPPQTIPPTVSTASHAVNSLTTNECAVTTGAATGVGCGAVTATVAQGGNFDGARSDPGTAGSPIDVWNICRYVDNVSGGVPVFVPFRSALEWGAFTANAPPAIIHLATCARPAVPVLPPGPGCGSPVLKKAAAALPYARTTNNPAAGIVETAQYTCTNTGTGCSSATQWVETVTATYLPSLASPDLLSTDPKYISGWTLSGVAAYDDSGAPQICAAAVAGQCGSASGAVMDKAPTSNLCSSGTPTAVTGNGPWSWTCQSANGGATASCATTNSPVVFTTLWSFIDTDYAPYSTSVVFNQNYNADQARSGTMLRHMFTPSTDNFTVTANFQNSANCSGKNGATPPYNGNIQTGTAIARIQNQGSQALIVSINWSGCGETQNGYLNPANGITYEHMGLQIYNLNSNGQVLGSPQTAAQAISVGGHPDNSCGMAPIYSINPPSAISGSVLANSACPAMGQDFGNDYNLVTIQPGQSYELRIDTSTVDQLFHVRGWYQFHLKFSSADAQQNVCGLYDPCNYTWEESFGQCVGTCGNVGSQPVTHVCKQISTGAAVADSYCSSMIKPADSTRDCYLTCRAAGGGGGGGGSRSRTVAE